MAVSGRYMLCFRCKCLLIVVLLMFFHRKCSGQGNFDCSTLQPQPANNFILGSPEETVHYTVTVDKPYYQQSSPRRVTVSAGALEFTDLYLQARIVNVGLIGGWSSPSPNGYTITACQGGLYAISKVGSEPAKSAVFEWVPAFADTSLDIMFMATFVNGAKYYIITSETISDQCNPSPCSADESCFRGDAPPGYICIQEACIALTCQNGGTCTVQNGEAECICPEGLTGTTCESCSEDFCQNGGNCIVNSGGQPQCLCPAAFSGTKCQFAQDGSTTACSSNPCLNGGTCGVQTDGSYQCTCSNGYLGIQCETQNAFCSTVGCRNGGTCYPIGLTSGTCVCPEGYRGSQCEEEDPCHNRCQNGGTCIDDDTVVTCDCLVGFQGFRCEISSGFCASRLCQNGATCIDTGSGGSCVCAEGFTGAACDQAITPGFCSFGLCQNGATCIDTTNSCVCAEGFTGPGCGEAILDLCIPNPCFNGGSCFRSTNAPLCVCTSDYTGTFCESVTPCSNQPCQNGGTCTFTPGSPGYNCQCVSPFLGTDCETESPCATNPCQNGGQCTPLTEGFSCTCFGAWSGPICAVENPCSPNPCLNTGTCSAISTTDFRCTCPSHVLGIICQIPNPCSPNPCLQGSPCQPAADGRSYTCNCPQGFTGLNCEAFIGETCRNSECVNGTCVEDALAARNYRCECQEGFDGDVCDNVIDYCLAFKPCLNDGTCTNDDSSYECNCVRPFFGDDCLFSRDNGPVFIDCTDTTHHYEIGSGNTAYVNLNITAMVPETGQVIDFDVIVGPDGVSFPGEVTYTEDYLEGQKFVLRATDEFSRESTCSFTIRLTDLVAPTVECPGDHEDISSKDRVVVSSLPLPPIEASDNIGLRAQGFLEYSPSEVRVDGVSRQVTVSVYDVAGNKEECQFGLIIHPGNECGSINTDNGRVTCSMNSAGNRVCEIMCDEGFTSPNGDLYRCTNGNWDQAPLPCLAMQEPNAFSKSITFVFSVATSLCDQDEFLTNVSKAMKAKLTELNLCGQGGSASACEENSISTSCNSQPAQDLRRKRQTTGSEIEIDVEVSGSSENDITTLITTIRNVTNEGFTLVVGDETLDLVSYDVTPQFIVACQSGSISRQGACLVCPLGTYHHSASNECRQCQAGSFQDEAGQLQCKECESDTFQDQLGQTSCITCDAGTTSNGVTCSMQQSPDNSWVTIVIYACVGVGALLVIIIFILMVCLWQSTQEEKKQDQKRWEMGHVTQLNKSYEPEEDTGFRPRVNTTVSTTTYQTVPEGDGTPNLGNGVTNGGHSLVRIPTEELYAGLTVDNHGRTLTVGVDNHPAPHPRRHQYEQNAYRANHHTYGDEFMSYGHDRHNFPV